MVSDVTYLFMIKFLAGQSCACVCTGANIPCHLFMKYTSVSLHQANAVSVYLFIGCNLEEPVSFDSKCIFFVVLTILVFVLSLLLVSRMISSSCASNFLWKKDEENEEDESRSIEIPLPNVKSEVLRKVIEFCEHHLKEPMSEIEKPLKSQNMADVVQKWYAEFVEVEQVLLFELILAANYMDIKPLLDLTCATVASMIKGKSPEDIRATFNITNDFSPEEEAQVREENRWCEEV